MKRDDIDQMRRDIGLPAYSNKEITDIKYGVLRKGGSFCLLTDKKHSLFFLIEGSIRARSSQGKEKRIERGHFFYVGNQSGFFYQAEENARCIILSFNDFQHPGNVEFFKEISPVDILSPDVFFVLPIKEPLYHIVNTMLVYMSDGFDYPNIHEAVFVLIRALYPPADVAVIFRRIAGRLIMQENTYFSQKLHT